MGGVSISSGRFQGNINGASHGILTLSIKKDEENLRFFLSLKAKTLASTFESSNAFSTIQPINLDSLVVQKLVSSKNGARSFSTNTILPIVKFYDPNTPSEKVVAGNPTTLFRGGVLAIYPTSRSTEFQQLANGLPVSNSTNDMLAEGIRDE